MLERLWFQEQKNAALHSKLSVCKERKKIRNIEAKNS